MFIMTTYKQISAKCLVPAQPAHCDNSLTDKVNKLEGEGEWLTRSTRGAGLSRKAVHDRSCSARQEFALAGKGEWELSRQQPLPDCVGSRISLVTLFFFPCFLSCQKQIMGENQELWFPANTVAQVWNPKWWVGTVSLTMSSLGCSNCVGGRSELDDFHYVCF